MLLEAEHVVHSVWMMREEGLVDGAPDLAAVLGEGHILLLVNGFQLGVEAPEHRMSEAVRLNAGPVIYLVGRYVLGVNGLVLGSPGIRSLCTYDGHKLVVLVRDGNEGGGVAQGVDPVIDGLAGSGVLSNAILLKEGFYLIEKRFLGGIVGGSEAFRSLEHKMLEVMGQTGSLERVVLGAHLYGYVGLDAGSFLVYAHIDLEAVVERIDLGSEGIPLHRLEMMGVA